ncbi:MAG: hypothetical protein JHC84_12645 [Solirubrobacteraceae bacterium]|nr:hypothetical protein [Solirubrobacteraceae bacterium]
MRIICLALLTAVVATAVPSVAHAGSAIPPNYAGTAALASVERITARLSTGKVSDPKVAFTVTTAEPNASVRVRMCVDTIGGERCRTTPQTATSTPRVLPLSQVAGRLSLLDGLLKTKTLVTIAVLPDRPDQVRYPLPFGDINPAEARIRLVW